MASSTEGDGEIERVPFATQFLEPVIRGDKDATVRIERYDVEAGDHIILTNDSKGVEWARAEVKYTVTCLAIEAGEILHQLDAEHALTNSDKHVREILQPHYSEPIRSGDTVQILVWEVVQPFAEAPRLETDGGQPADEVDRPPEEQLRIDLLNAFYQAFKSGVSETEVAEHVEYALETAKEDANVE